MKEAIIKVLQTLATNIEGTSKEYIDEKITKEDKRTDINMHVTIAAMRIDKIIESNIE